MVIVMKTSPDKPTDLESADAYGDEVLNANWLPQPELAADQGQGAVRRRRKAAQPEDVDAFLQSVYRNQE
jgi:hypothetical protein